MMRLTRVGMAISSRGGLGFVETARFSSSSLQSFRYNHDATSKSEPEKKDKVVTDKDSGVDGQEGRGKSKDDEINEEEISPEWLSMERRVKNHKPKPKGQGAPEGRSRRITSGWDAENV